MNTIERLTTNYDGGTVGLGGRLLYLPSHAGVERWISLLAGVVLLLLLWDVYIIPLPLPLPLLAHRPTCIFPCLNGLHDRETTV